MARECSLCGGKLRGNICTECGLDNSKSDASYKTNESHDWGTELTHSHHKVDPMAGKTMTRKQQEELKASIKSRKGTQKKVTGGSTVSYDGYQSVAGRSSNQYQYDADGDRKVKKAKGGCLGNFFAILIIIILIFSAISSIVEEMMNDISWGTATPEYEEYVYDPYGDVDYELSDIGEEYKITLTPGTYVGGVHLPEGIYEVTLIEGSGELSMSHPEQNIYVSNSAYETEEGDVLNADFRVYSGARIELKDDIELAFSSQNAILPMEEMVKNPMVGSVTVEESFVVGEDIEAGVYDVYCLKGSGIFDYSVEIEDEYYSYEGKLIGTNGSSFPECYKNMVLPEGVEVLIEDMEIELVPSEYIWDVDLDHFYEN